MSRVCDLLLFQKRDPKGATPCSKETRMGTSKEGSVSPFPVAKGWGQSYDGIKRLSIFVRSKSPLGGGPGRGKWFLEGFGGIKDLGYLEFGI